MQADTQGHQSDLQKTLGNRIRLCLRATLDDIAILTGGKSIMEETGIKLEGLRLRDLGRAKLVTIDKDTSIVDGDGGMDY